MTVSSGYEGENVLAATLTKGRLAIKFDTSKVAAAYVDSSNQEIANKSGYYSSNGQFCISWVLKGEVLEEDPGIPLSSIHDTLEIVVMYHDLTREVITLDVSLNDEGQVFITRIENKVSV